ncbi:terminase [Synechococcales cyanobacterium C]|uniref:Terminase n=1 Tax=Petrachloros mirabilis ULC683 TaxID=2781853 RepID=A0A8K2A865_9CYAN|nr:terminase family protein [Petrachloros mirabilis]NCJ06665.1 terminase [Petrachloros mirabilis ULC683]
MSAITLYPYQKRWLQDDSRFKIGMFARQTGKTFTNTLEIVDRCIRAEIEGRRERWVILSRGERQAKEAIEEGVKRHLKAFEIAFEALEYEYEGTYKAMDVVLPRGSVISALPANPDTARGYSANVLLDEFAFHRDSRKIWMALFPVISAGHLLRVVSTPNGKGNKFYDLMTSPDPTWSRHQVDIHQAVAEGLPRDVEELRRALNDPDAWSQEFLLQWLDEASAWLSYDLINTCEAAEAGQPDAYTGGDVYVGNDVGLRGDLWVAWVVERLGDVFWTREIRTLRRSTFAEHDAVIAELFDRYKVRRLCVDQTGLGERTTEEYQRRYGSTRVEGVLFTSANKQALATLGKQCFEDRRIRIPEGDSALRNDLHKLKKITTATGGVRFDADRDSSGHADRAWSCFLALNAAITPTVPIEYQAAGARLNLAAFAGATPHLEQRGFGAVAGAVDMEGWA